MCKDCDARFCFCKCAVVERNPEGKYKCVKCPHEVKGIHWGQIQPEKSYDEYGDMLQRKYGNTGLNIPQDYEGVKDDDEGVVNESEQINR